MLREPGVGLGEFPLDLAFLTRSLRTAKAPLTKPAMFHFQIAQVGEGGLQAEFVAIPGVDAAHQRFDQVFVSERPRRRVTNSAQGLIPVLVAAGQEEIQSHAAFGRPGEQPGADHRAKFGGDHHGQAAGQFVKFAVLQDVGLLGLRVRAREPLR